MAYLSVYLFELLNLELPNEKEYRKYKLLLIYFSNNL